MANTSGGMTLLAGALPSRCSKKVTWRFEGDLVLAATEALLVAVGEIAILRGLNIICTTGSINFTFLEDTTEKFQGSTGVTGAVNLPYHPEAMYYLVDNSAGGSAISLKFTLDDDGTEFKTLVAQFEVYSPPNRPAITHQ